MLRNILRSKIASRVKNALGDVAELARILLGGRVVDQEIDQSVTDDLLGHLAGGEVVPARPPIPNRREPQTNIESDDWRLPPHPEPPVMEGMYPVSSSNVHSIGYLFPPGGTGNGSLMVRFLGGDSKNRSGPGPLYKYKDVPVAVWNHFKYADSAGKAVWDDLRVRGTVSGHQYDYDLAEAGEDGYVPRQAIISKRGELGEYFVPRTINGQRSQLPEQRVRRGQKTNLPGWDRRSNLRPRQ